MGAIIPSAFYAPDERLLSSGWLGLGIIGFELFNGGKQSFVFFRTARTKFQMPFNHRQSLGGILALQLKFNEMVELFIARFAAHFIGPRTKGAL
ncbi:MAG: hypothetical protein WD740_04775 [Anaerolineales bacterium]